MKGRLGLFAKLLGVDQGYLELDIFGVDGAPKVSEFIIFKFFTQNKLSKLMIRTTFCCSKE